MNRNSLHELTNINLMGRIQLTAVFTVLSIVAIGMALITHSLAATPTVSFEVEDGAKDTNVVLITNDNTASGGGAVKFGNSTISITKPSTSNTGVPIGQTLTVPTTDITKGITVATNGNVTITKGGLFTNMLIKGRLNIKANDVTIRNSRVEGNPSPWDLPTEPQSVAECQTNGSVSNNLVSAFGVMNLLIEDSSLVAVRPSTYLGNAMYGSGYTLRQVDISNTIDGAGAFNIDTNNVLIENSFIHDLYTAPYDYYHSCGPTHSDGIQVHYGATTTIRNNTIRANSTGPNGTAAGSNAAIQVNQNSTYYTSRLTIDHNWIDYGGCSVNIADGAKSPTIQYFNLTNNIFGKNQTFAGCAMIVSNATKANITNFFSGNVWEDGSTPVPAVRNGG